MTGNVRLSSHNYYDDCYDYYDDCYYDDCYYDDCYYYDCYYYDYYDDCYYDDCYYDDYYDDYSVERGTSSALATMRDSARRRIAEAVEIAHSSPSATAAIPFSRGTS